MSGAKQPSALAATEADMSLLLAAQTHIGSKNCERAMEPYVFKRRADGIHLLNLGKTWEKLVFAARIIAAVENPADVCVISGRPYGQRAVLKFAAHTGATAIAGRFTPGSFTNYITRSFKEPRVIVVTDPRVDHQAIREASYTNIPVIALCDTDAPLRHVDVVVPGNNKGQHSIGLLWWLLAREVLRLRGSVPRGDDAWEVMPDLYFFRDPEAQESEAAAEAAEAATSGAAVETQGDAELAGSAPGNLALAVAANENVDWAADPAADAAAAGDWAADVPAGAATTSWE